MANELQKISDSNVSEVLSEIHSAYFDIPFENSEFQNKAFVLAAQITPERAYRQLGLRLHTRLSALNHAKFTKMREEVSINEKLYLSSLAGTSEFDKQRYAIDIMELEASREMTNKLINDCLVECNYLYNEFKKFPRYTREQFEAAEEQHFIERSKRQVLGVTGAAESLFNISHDVKAMQDTIDTLLLSKDEDYLKITSNMSNRVKVSEGTDK